MSSFCCREWKMAQRSSTRNLLRTPRKFRSLRMKSRRNRNRLRHLRRSRRKSGKRNKMRHLRTSRMMPIKRTRSLKHLTRNWKTLMSSWKRSPKTPSRSEVLLPKSKPRKKQSLRNNGQWSQSLKSGFWFMGWSTLSFKLSSKCPNLERMIYSTPWE